MKRKLIIMAVLLAILVGFGMVLHSPPSIVDAITGVTPRAKRTERTKAQLEGNYIFCINNSINGMESDSVRDELKRVFSGESDHLTTGSITTITVYLSETDYALVRYAKTLCNRFAKADITVDIKKYSETMLRSRILSRKYEMFLAAEDFLDIKALENADYIVVSSSEMR